MKTRLLFSLLTLLTVSHYSVAESVSRLIWKNQPLPVTLKPGSEVRVVFPANVNKYQYRYWIDSTHYK